MRHTSIVAALLDHAARAPNRTLVHFDDTTYSRAAICSAAAAWAGAYRATGIEPGDRIALFLENSPDFIAAYFGAHMAGAIVVLVNTQYRRVELQHILRDSGARLCVTDQARQVEIARLADEPEGMPPMLERVVVAGVNDAAFLAASKPVEPIAPDPESVAIIGYTSGTTGRAKGAMIRHRNLAANAWAVTTAWHWTEPDRLLLALPLFHAHGLCVGLHGTVYAGAEVDVRRRFEVGDALSTIAGGATTMFFGVPTMYTRLIAEARQRAVTPPPLRLYVSGSAPLAVQTFEEFAELFGQPILERYGMTETIMNTTNPYVGERRAGTVGQPFPGQEARIVDVVSRRPIDDEAPGEIQVRGPHVFAGYWDNEAATAEAFDAEGWFNTGDLGWRSSDGYITISGRARELIISGGFNIYPREIEEVLVTHPSVAEAAVFGAPDPEFGERVVAVIVPTAADAATEDDIVAYCRDRLASYKKPRVVRFVAGLPRNAMAKVQKHVLRDDFLAGALG
ncbi:MAG: long-chain fatty acid--CoA ligase [Chloroflexota bacterium]|nr:MAG: long-chain fatty acid--CoA ligase [Chloroflexota bacterium]